MNETPAGEFSPDTRRNIEVELSKLDAAAQGMSVILDAKLKVYDHDPVRILQLKHNDVDKSIHISALFRDPSTGDVPGNITFGFWALASADINGERRFWSKKIVELDVIPDDYAEQLSLFQTCWKFLKPISHQDLKPFGHENPK
jgi:hypothetical protein